MFFVALNGEYMRKKSAFRMLLLTLASALTVLSGCGKQPAPPPPAPPVATEPQDEGDGITPDTLSLAPSTAVNTTTASNARTPKTPEEAVKTLAQSKSIVSQATTDIDTAVKEISRSLRDKEDPETIRVKSPLAKNPTLDPNSEAYRTAQAAAVASIQNRLSAAIQKRLDAINRLRSRLAALKNISQNYRSIIRGSLDTAERELKQIENQAEGEANLDTLNQLATDVVDNLGIYDVEIPKSEGLIAVSSAQTTAEEINAALIKLQESLIAAEQNGIPTDEARQELTELKTAVAEVMDQLESAANELLSISTSLDDNAIDERLESAQTLLEEASEQLSAIQSELSETLPGIEQLIEESENTGNLLPGVRDENDPNNIRRVQ